jgi:DNA polymerase I-like protein with 3'-5' exonuclease and polymerase domains
MDKIKAIKTYEEGGSWLRAIGKQPWSYGGVYINRVPETKQGSENKAIIEESATVACVNISTSAKATATFTGAAIPALRGMGKKFDLIMYNLNDSLEWLKSNGVEIEASYCNDIRAIQHLLHAGILSRARRSETFCWHESNAEIARREEVYGLKNVFAENGVIIKSWYNPMLVSGQDNSDDLAHLAVLAEGLVTAFTSMKNVLFRRNQLSYYYSILQPTLVLGWKLQVIGIPVNAESVKVAIKDIAQDRNKILEKLKSPELKFPVNSSIEVIEEWAAAVPEQLKQAAESMMAAYADLLKKNSLLTALDEIQKQSQQTGRVHPRFWCETNTGRASTRQPAVSNISRKYRYIFDTGSDERVLVGSDLSSLEVRAAMSLFGDITGMEDCEKGDIYCTILRRALPQYADFSDVTIKLDYTKERDRAKQLLLGLVYGRGVASIALELGITEIEADVFVQEIKTRYRTLFDGIERSLREVDLFKFARTRRGFIRHLPAHLQNAFDSSNQRQMRNFFVQGAAAETFFAAVLKLPPLLKRYGADIVFLLHDMVLVECSRGQAESVVAVLESVLAAEYEASFPGVKFTLESRISRTWGKDGNAV